MRQIGSLEFCHRLKRSIGKTAFFLLITLGVAFLFPVKAIAAAGPWEENEEVRARMVAESDTATKDTEKRFAIQVQLSSGWHTYWRSPGEAGLPPEWKLAGHILDRGDILSSTILYPAPTRYDVMGIETIGYEKEVLFPLDIKRKNNEFSYPPLEGAFDIMVCRELCLLKHFTLKLDTSSFQSADTSEDILIQKAFEKLPNKITDSPYKMAGIERTTDSLRLSFMTEGSFSHPDIFIETKEPLAFAKPETTLSPDQKIATFVFRLAEKPEDNNILQRQSFRITLTDNEEAVETDSSAAPSLPSPQSEKNGDNGIERIFLLAIALLGGFILNLTPCVLPVLSLKILGVVSHGGRDGPLVRRSFLMTAGGIVFSFLVIATGMMGLQEAGKMAGWGMQFQHPLFLVFLAVLLTFLAANLWELFEIPLPRFLADRIDPSYHPKLAGDFATGALATLLATPCTAPFLGTAIGFALAAGHVEILMTFSALGVGMALPYLLIALFPRLATSLPKPGFWMVRLKHFLGGALALTVLWLLFVLAVQIETRQALIIGSNLAGILVILGLIKKNLLRRTAQIALVFLSLSTFLIAGRQSLSSSNSQTDGAWQTFDEVTLAQNLREGKTVFVDITADWCLNCKANDRFTFQSESVQKALFHTPQIVALRGDWTSPDASIAAFLQRHGRYGIPFNAVFSPRIPDGLILNELLTPGAVLEALEQAQGKN